MAKENVKSSKLQDASVRFIVDDVIKFVEREIRRGNKYDGIIMDPPSYGRGANGEVWSIEKDLFYLVTECSKLLSDNPIFLIINTYTGGLSGTIIQNIVRMALSKKDFSDITTNEIGLKCSNSSMLLPCGITTKWENNK